MSNGRDAADFLAKLREDLKHFDESGHLIDDPNVVWRGPKMCIPYHPIYSHLP